MTHLSRSGMLKLWAALVFVTVAMHSTTLVWSPVFWIDEVQILDFGRSLVFEPDTTWSISWLPEERPAATYGYLGPALQEGVYRMSGFQAWAPRLASVLGGAAAATALLLWLWARGVGASASLLGGALLLVEPVLVQSSRGGRVDGWAIAAALGAAWAFRRASEGRERSLVLAGVSGAMAATAPFLWPTAVATLVAVGVELAQARRARGFAAIAAAFTAGAAVTGAALVGVYVMLQGNPLAQADVALGAQFVVGEWRGPAEMIPIVLDALVRSLVLWLIAVLAVLTPSARPLAVATGVALLILAPSRLYAYRFLYALPVAAAAGAALFASRRQLVERGHRRLAAVVAPLLLASVVLGAVISLGARQAVAWNERVERDPAPVYAAAQRIGAGDMSVFIGEVEFYHPGRQLGWRMFRPYGEQGDHRPPELLARMDFAITGQEEHDVMAAAGLVLVASIAPASPMARYGPYWIYKRSAVRAPR